MHDLNAAPGPDALDELDLALVNALQLAPRASWSDLAPVLGAAPATLARRWRRLTGTGAAWMTGFMGVPQGIPSQVGKAVLVEITVAPGRIPQVIAELSRQPNIINIEHLTGGRDLFACVYAPDAGRLAHYLQVGLPAVSGISGIRVQMPLRLYKDSAAWRLRALDRDQRRQLAELGRVPALAPFALDADDLAIVEQLGPDGRVSTAELSRRLGLSGVTVARRLSRLMGAGYARFRCEVARSLTGWPCTATWWLRVPPDELDATAAELSGGGDVRMCATVTGPANLILVMYLRSAADAGVLEADWARRFPRMAVQDSAMTLQVVKCLGRLVDTNGFGTGFVPLGMADEGGAERGMASVPA
ncbi:MAG: Lrp/AsnC family transcriptional regulator [Streptomycetaceae bacterium]|nr:Lrp/AsnC family transcriptional regulator [Streptomycetaceae bacterium]